MCESVRDCSETQNGLLIHSSYMNDDDPRNIRDYYFGKISRSMLSCSFHAREWWIFCLKKKKKKEKKNGDV